MAKRQFVNESLNIGQDDDARDQVARASSVSSSNVPQNVSVCVCVCVRVGVSESVYVKKRETVREREKSRPYRVPYIKQGQLTLSMGYSREKTTPSSICERKRRPVLRRRCLHSKGRHAAH